MADNTSKCGEITVTYPSTCSFVCYCNPRTGCHWWVYCSGTIFGGTGFTLGPRESHQ
jgi:hypothetical protein